MAGNKPPHGSVGNRGNRYVFTEEARDKLRKFRGVGKYATPANQPGNDPSLGSGKKSPDALKRAYEAAGGKKQLTPKMVKEAQKGKYVRRAK